MRPLSAATLLDVWERGRLWSPVERALSLLAEASPETTPEALARLPVGERDGRLLTLRAWTFGPALASVVSCPACGDRLELSFTVDDVRAAPAFEPPEALAVSLYGYDVTFRLPDSVDLAAIDGLDADAGAGLLLERCLVAGRREGEAVPLDALPDGVVAAVTDRLAQADPQADVQLSLACPACGHRWPRPFDIAAYFWHEIEAWAPQALREVHLLAGSYGWPEADILAMSAWRRQFYLAMIEG